MPKYDFARSWDIVRYVKELDKRLRKQEVLAGPLAVSSYNVAWTATTTNPSLGDGALVGRYFRSGSIVGVSINLIYGPATNPGSGEWHFSLPLAVTATASYAGSAYAEHLNNKYLGTAILESGSSTCYVETGQATGTWDDSGSNPFAWGSGDVGVITAQYETD